MLRSSGRVIENKFDSEKPTTAETSLNYLVLNRYLPDVVLVFLAFRRVASWRSKRLHLVWMGNAVKKQNNNEYHLLPRYAKCLFLATSSAIGQQPNKLYKLRYRLAGTTTISQPNP